MVAKIQNPKEREERRKETRRNYYHKNREEELKKMKDWREKNKDKLKIYKEKDKFRNSVKSWTQRHYKKEKCFFCLSKENLEFHHFIYKKPVEKEDFIILCRTCHKRIHRGALIL